MGTGTGGIGALSLRIRHARCLCQVMPRSPKKAGLTQAPPPKPDAIESAKEAGLRYVRDDAPGIRRMKVGNGFRYVDPSGRAISRADEVRIKALAIPPAWRDVWICPHPNGHIQAVGRDDRGRKQYRYHPEWTKVRDESKYSRMIEFVTALPKIRKAVQRHLALPGLSREKVLATVVRLLETTLIRVGNDEYAKSNKSFGLTTMRDKHVKVRGQTIDFQFRGKSGGEHAIDLDDARLAKIVRQCQDLPGAELFQYVDDLGKVCDVGSGDVNAYLKEISGHDFTAKDFRTWAGTVLAARALQEFERVDSKAAMKKNIVRAIESVAMRLGNTKAVCRKCYIHPDVLDSYMDGSLVESLSRKAGNELARSLKNLPAEEAAVLALLQQRLANEATSKRSTSRRAAA